MCRKSSGIATVSYGQRRSCFVYYSHSTWIAVYFLLLFVLSIMLLPCCDARASDVSSTRRLITEMQTQQLHQTDLQSDPFKDDWEQGNLYIGRSGDPWGAVSIKQQESIYARIPPINFTYNNSEDDHLLIRRKESVAHSRNKRGVVHLYNMVVCATGCNPLAYKGYGCYCGFLGSGYVIDGIDRCCKMHDWCYDATECPMFSEYFVPYYWKCYRGYKPICAVDHGNWGGSGSCAQRLCECDRSLAECLRRYPCPTSKAVCTSSPWRLVQNLFMTM